MTLCIYVLQLSDGKYYVGKTTRMIHERFQEHCDGRGSSYTRKHKPIQIIRIISNASDYDEDRYVKEYMNIYGIENVRGGSYISEILSNSDIEILTKEIRMAQNVCFGCGKVGHFITECYTKVKNDTNPVNSPPPSFCDRKVFKGQQSPQMKSPNLMKRYGEFNEQVHFSREIYNKIITKLRENEYIVKKAKEHLESVGAYNVTYITNFGTIIYATESCSPIFDGIKIIPSSEKLPDTIIDRIKQYHFKSSHYSKIKIELDNLIKGEVVSYI